MSSEPECGSKTAPPVGFTESIGGKRKRGDEGERAGKLAKKQKPVLKETQTIIILDSPDSASGGTPEATDSVARSTGRKRRSLRNKQGADEEPKPTEDKKQCDSVIILDTPPPSETCAKGRKKILALLFPFPPRQAESYLTVTASVTNYD